MLFSLKNKPCCILENSLNKITENRYSNKYSYMNVYSINIHNSQKAKIHEVWWCTPRELGRGTKMLRPSPKHIRGKSGMAAHTCTPSTEEVETGTNSRRPWSQYLSQKPTLRLILGSHKRKRTDCWRMNSVLHMLPQRVPGHGHTHTLTHSRTHIHTLIHTLTHTYTCNSKWVFWLFLCCINYFIFEKLFRLEKSLESKR